MTGDKFALLYDLDRTDWRNRNLMLAAAHYRSLGYEVVLNARNPASYPAGTQIHASVVFIRNRYKVYDLLASVGVDVKSDDPIDVDLAMPDHIRIGGTGWNILKKASDIIEQQTPCYDLYDRVLGPADYNQGFLTRGCPRGCDFCVVPKMSGGIASPVSTFADLWATNPTAKYTRLMDDNFLAGPKDFVRGQLEWAITHKKRFSLTQGADIRFMNEEWADLLAQSRFVGVKGANRMITFAFDSPKIEKQYRRGFEMLMEAGRRHQRRGYPGIAPYHIASFVLTGFDSTIEDDMRRIDVLRELGAYPYVMVYEPIHGESIPSYYLENPQVLAVYGEHLTTEERYYRHWQRCKHLQRWTNLRQLWKTVPTFDAYEAWIRQQQRWAEEDRLGIRPTGLRARRHRQGWNEVND